jgi:hypothetical protein
VEPPDETGRACGCEQAYPACRRRPTDAGADWWAEQIHRLRHARQHADLTLDTDGLTSQEVLDRTLAFLASVAGSGG